MGLTEVERAYIAGFFDGEGCVNIRCCERKTKNGTITASELTIALSNNDFNVLNFIHSKMGGRIHKRYDKDHTHSLRMEALKAVKFLEIVYPYLITKKKQAEIGIRFQSLIGQRGKKVTNVDERLRLVASIKEERKSINCLMAEGGN